MTQIHILSFYLYVCLLSPSPFETRDIVQKPWSTLHPSHRFPNLRKTIGSHLDPSPVTTDPPTQFPLRIEPISWVSFLSSFYLFPCLRHHRLRLLHLRKM